ncbi:hypothetical protein RUM43_003769 [Polyplax serrata]|uniref:Uncharacterized protein n=1 Tax=Polyplax serrata TaxID=468196 RepID=A0AAN8RXI1_POLSC
MDYQFLGECLKIENFRGGSMSMAPVKSPGFSKIKCALNCNPFESSVELWVVGYKKTMKKVSLHLATPQSPINPSCGSQMGFKTF